MELAASIDPLICPTAPFLEPYALTLFRDCQNEYQELDNDKSSELRWSVSLLNPLNRPNALYASTNPRWRIDGCEGMGCRFFALPVFMFPNLPVKRIDVMIPCQSQQPPALRRALRSSSAFGMSSRAVNKLEICQFLVSILDYWSARQPYFEEIYRSLPFGSVIVVENIPVNIEKAKVRFLPNHDFKGKLMTTEHLQNFWKLSQSSWPPLVSIGKLQQAAVLNGNVSLVRLSNMDDSRKFAFKTNLRSIKYLYHELKVLLSIESHENIISKPLYIVTEDDGDDRSNSGKIIGMLSEYYPSGNLSQFLDSGATISLRLKLKWARQITQTLCNIREGPAQFYSDLKPDNLVLSHPSHDIIMIDFEQAGNWDTFSAPEIFYLDWMEKLARHNAVPEQRRQRYNELIRVHLPNLVSKDETYSNPPSGYNIPWISLASREQESAMVYSLGKVLWCIFEGCSHTTNSLGEKQEKRAELEFPQFSSTPDTIRTLIRRCTLGAPEWTSIEKSQIVREGPLFFAEVFSNGRYVRNGSPKAAIDLARDIWTRRLKYMEGFVEAKSRFLQGTHDQNDEQLLGFPLRPRLIEVLAEIETASINCTDVEQDVEHE